MSLRKTFDLSAYLVIGPENTLGRPVKGIIRQAVEAGFSFIQIRSKEASARELIQLTKEAAEVLEELNKEKEVALVVNDRLDVILAAKEQGIQVGGIHVGQSDIPVEVCRQYLGEDAIIGLSARTHELMEYVSTVETKDIDYFGAGPLHETQTKPDCGLDDEGKIITRSMEELRELARISPLPVVVGGGVKAEDLKELAATGVQGFFVVSAVAGAKDPYQAAKELVDTWEAAQQ